ncbi:uncharacterized protein [Argopecten irradians]|uniref:uncharacterized protein n=1 Tax=Argopecten irradians TaxID=31199 RepID=UPI00371C9853
MLLVTMGLKEDNAADDPTTALKLVWERLEERFGAPELIESSIRRQIAQLPKINSHDVKKLYDLVDLVDEIASVKRQPRYASLFGYFDSPTGINPLVVKLPTGLQDRWTTAATKFKKCESSVYPPFTFFVSFLKDIAKMKNDPSFNYSVDHEKSSGNHSRNSRTSAIVSVRKTETAPSVTHDSSETSESPRCPVHHTRHSLNECNSFRSRPIKDRKQFIMTQGLCFKCCGPTKHRTKQCTNYVKCCVCGGLHPGALHEDCRHQEKKGMVTHEGEQRTEKVSSSCTQICGAPGGTSKSCAKIIPVRIYHKDSKQHSRTVYALIDDQSNHSLASPSFFDTFGQDSPDYQYTLVSCSGTITMSGRRASGFQIESLDGECCFALPTLIECTELPNNREEIPSRRVAENFNHLADIKDRIPDLMEDVQIEILIGRDLIDAHIVQDQRKGASGMPYAQKLPLGWVIIGMVCLNAQHLPNKITVHKTYILDNGRSSILQSCENKLLVKNNIFAKTEQDEKPAHSIEDTIFLDLMDEDFRRNSDGYWEAPLPFRPQRQPLPNNRPQALNRALSLDRSIRRNPIKKDHVSAFMDKIFQKGHAEEAPPIPDTVERWYLPMFGVYHPKKKESIRMVFDSSAKFNSISLNEALLKGPDITNNLQGILLRFRRERVAVTGDVEQMFHNFKVRIDHRDYLRFLWHPENNLDLPLKEYRMTVHVFGNRPSPAVATYGLRRSVAHSDSDVIDFVTRDFYVDDGLLSCPTEDAAVDLMQRTQLALKEGGQLRLHKIASNSKSVLSKFPVDDLAKDLKDFDVGDNDLPIQRSLGGLLGSTLDNINIPRMCCKFSLIEATHREVHIFTDASKNAIAAVAFLKVWKDSEKNDIGFLTRKAKVAPTNGHTIPRLELCAAVLGIEIAEIIKEQLNFEQRDFWFYSDSQVILGYVTNEARRFYVYVANRVSRIRTFSKPDHWQHVATD